MTEAAANPKVSVWLISLRPVDFDSRVLRFIGTARKCDPNYAFFNVSSSGSGVALSGLKLINPPRLTRLRKAWALLRALFGGAEQYYAEKYGFRKWLRSLDLSELPSILVTFDLEALAFARLLKSQLGEKASFLVMADLHEDYPGEVPASGFKNLVRKYLVTRFLRDNLPFADFLSCTGQDLGERIASQFQRIPVVLPNTPVRRLLAPSPVSGTIRLVYHGLYSPLRGYDTLLQAFARVRGNYQLNLVVPEGNFSDIRDLINQLEIEESRIVLHDFVPSSELVDFLNEFDVEIIPTALSSPNAEVLLPNKLFEAISARLAVVSTPLPNVVKVLEEWECGILAPGFGFEDLVTTIESLTPSLVEQMKFKSSLAAETLNWEHYEPLLVSKLKTTPLVEAGV